MNINPVSFPSFAVSDILNHAVTIESWFRHQWQCYPPSLTCSVDIRNAGYKLAAIDANLFPAGFNNLNVEFLPLCIQAFQNILLTRYPTCQNILIISESHSRNLYYYQSIATLEWIIKKAGY
jgi:glutamate--cysteine ligase